MKFQFGSLVAAVLAASVTSVDAIKILMAGDSTMAYTSTANMQGWGYPFANYVNLQVVNLARGGRSARTYTTEGLFAALVAQVQPGDYVIIEFGHNDGGSTSTSTRAPAAGDGSQTVTVTNADGTVEVVQTFVTYLKWAIRDVIAKGGIPVVSSTTPNGDAWNDAHTEMLAPNRFVPYAKMAAGNYTSQGATYVDHYEFVTRHFEALGYANVYPALFPNDHTHTNAAGADHVARAFISGIACGNHAMANYLTPAGAALTKMCGGTTTTPGTGTVAKYGQCGGIGYTGSTTCVSGSTCTYSNAYYSQCL